MKAIRKLTLTTVITIILVSIIAFCISGTVISQNKGQSRVEEAYYHTIEQEYVQQVRSILTEKGYSNSGVTMTRVIDSDGTREYTVAIHHKRITKLQYDAKQELLEGFSYIEYPVENCRISYEILI